jgi:hypothetical protein
MFLILSLYTKELSSHPDRFGGLTSRSERHLLHDKNMYKKISREIERYGKILRDRERE